jgi:hypothetical protein
MTYRSGAERRLSIAALAVCALLAVSSKASALDAYAGLLGGYGFATERHDVQPYGAGFGLDGGVTLPEIPIYIGARVQLFAGQTRHLPPELGSVRESERYLLYGLDLGYDVELGTLLLRPEVGIGAAHMFFTLDAPLTSTSTGGSSLLPVPDDLSLYLAPALELLWKLSHVYFGAEIRYLALTANGHISGLLLLAHGGLSW